MSDRIGDRQQGPASDEQPTNGTRSFPSQDAMRPMAEACGCSPPAGDLAGGCCGNRERSTRTSDATPTQGEVAG